MGDKTTLVIAPLVASLGLVVGKMSGRGLSFSGGTIDKLESIRGFNVALSREQFLQQLAEHGIVVSGQSVDLAPADGKLYALRDVTATVDSIPLIASSIMSKKIAAGAHAIVLDVKVGSGAFMKTDREAEALAHQMIDIGRGVNRRVAAVISDMSQPLGQAVGNALEVKEAIATLHGGGPADFRRHCLTVGGLMLVLANRATDLEKAEKVLAQALDDGTAWNKFVEWITSQGGDRSVLENPELLPQAPLIQDLPAPQAGYIAGVDALTVGTTGVMLGGGREKKGDPIDYGVGIICRRKIGEWVEAGAPLFTIHANSTGKLEEANRRLLTAVTWSQEPVQPPPHTHKILL